MCYDAAVQVARSRRFLNNLDSPQPVLRLPEASADILAL
jgi:hypothetical protein